MKRDLRAALPAWLAARAVVLGSLALTHLLARRLGTLPTFAERHLHEGILGWDAVRYRQIAEFGYEALPEIELRFFPLVPLLTRALGVVLGGRYDIALLVVANVSALALGAVVHRLALHETGDAALAARAVWFTAFAPAAFVLVWGYSEAVAGTLVAAGFLALRRKRWWWAAAFGLLGGLARPVGLLMVVPAVVEAARARRDREALVAKVAAVVAPVAGCVAYLAWVGNRFGDFFLPFEVQQRPNFRGDFVNPLRILYNATTAALDGRWEGNALHLPWVVVAGALVVVAVRRWPLSYGLYAAAAFVLAVGAPRLGSFARYAFGAVPLTLAAATAFRTEAGARAALVVGAGAMTIYCTLALLGAYVP